MPLYVTVAALSLSIALAGMGWLAMAPRDRTRDQILANASLTGSVPEEWP